MGNVNTKKEENSNRQSFSRKNVEFVDKCINYGSLIPQGIYTSEPEYDIEVIRQFIILKKLAPFYKGSPDYVENPYPIEVISKSPSTSSTATAENNSHEDSSSNITQQQHMNENNEKSKNNIPNESDPSTSLTHNIFSKTEFFKYQIECPICFLYYPRNINYTRCCDQPICTECFIQIKRTYANPGPTCCPYCVKPNFGVCYLSPDSDEYLQQYEILIKVKECKCNDEKYKELISQGSTPGKKRRNTISHTDTQVVTSDDIYPGWIVKYDQYIREQQLLEEMRIRSHNAQTRALNSENANAAILNALFHLPIRPRSYTPHNNSSGQLRVVGGDLEELMVLEAIRRSLAETEQTENNADSNQINNLTNTENSNRNDQSEENNETNNTEIDVITNDIINNNLSESASASSLNESKHVENSETLNNNDVSSSTSASNEKYEQRTI